MKPAPQMDFRQQVLERTSVAILGEMLACAGDPAGLLEAALKQALHLVEGSRGLVLDPEKLIHRVGYAAEEGEALRKELVRLLDPARARDPGLILYSGPRFTRPGERPASGVGMTGVLASVSPPGLLAVVAVEREQPFSAAEGSWLREWLQLASPSVAAAMESTRGRLRAADLPLERLEEVPRLAEMERLVIAEALRRTGNNKTRAARALGITREGLRKKLQRLQAPNT